MRDWRGWKNSPGLPALLGKCTVLVPLGEDIAVVVVVVWRVRVDFVMRWGFIGIFWEGRRLEMRIIKKQGFCYFYVSLERLRHDEGCIFTYTLVIDVQSGWSICRYLSG